MAEENPSSGDAVVGPNMLATAPRSSESGQKKYFIQWKRRTNRHEMQPSERAFNTRDVKL